MLFFKNPKPRRFHHEYIYVNERKERIEKLKARHEQQHSTKAGQADEQSGNAVMADEETYRQEMKAHISETLHIERKRRKSGNILAMLPLGLMILLLVLMFLVVYYCYL